MYTFKPPGKAAPLLRPSWRRPERARKFTCEAFRARDKIAAGGFQLPGQDRFVAMLPRMAGSAKVADCDAVRNKFKNAAKSAACELKELVGPVPDAAAPQFDGFCQYKRIVRYAATRAFALLRRRAVGRVRKT
jgi:hypothetical protein